MALPSRPLVVTGQQIGAGWTPALSVAKALAAMALAQRLGGEAVYWLADEDHDREEVARSCAWEGARLRRHRFRFEAPAGTAAGWLPWTARHQAEARSLWGEVPEAAEPTLRSHALACGRPLWNRGLRPFVPTEAALREPLAEELARWRALDLEAALRRQAERLEADGSALPLDPRVQAAWFSLDPATGLRRRLEPGEALPKGCWLSPGAALRPLLQSRLLAPTHAVLGPTERVYWRLAEPLWERVGLVPPALVPRPSVFVLPKGLTLAPGQLEALRAGWWEAFLPERGPLPSQALALAVDPSWGTDLGNRARQELARSRHRLLRLDRRLARDRAAGLLGEDPERLRQRLFPFGKPQERVLPGLPWLRDLPLLERIHGALREGAPLVMVEET